MQTTTTIITQTRNLGYGWSTTHAPAKPDHVGTVKAVRRAIVERTRLIGPGTYYYERLFVGGVPVSDDGMPNSILEILNEVDTTGDCTVRLNLTLRSAAIAGVLGVSPQTVRDWYRGDRLPGAWLTDGGEVRMRHDDACELRDEIDYARSGHADNSLTTVAP
jgi:hypothetical protein